MAKAIGPNFANELAAYGAAHGVAIMGAHFTWFADGTLEFFEDTPSEVQAAVAAVYAAHDSAKPDPAKAAPALLAAGVAITSAGTPAVNGTYACDDAQQSIITRLQTYIEKNGAFPGGLGAVQLRLDSGAMIPIPSVALFQAIGSAIADFVAKIDEAELAALAGGAWVAPGNTAAIA